MVHNCEGGLCKKGYVKHVIITKEHDVGLQMVLKRLNINDMVVGLFVDLYIIHVVKKVDSINRNIEMINMPWISVNERLPEDRTLVWIYVVYDDSPYDNVKSRISIGVYYNNESWTDILDSPFADDYTVLYWMPLEFPNEPKTIYNI